MNRPYLKLVLVLTLSVLFCSASFANGIFSQDTIYVVADDCFSDAQVCVDIPYEAVSGFRFWQNGQGYSGNIAACGFETNVFYDYTSLFGEGEMGPYMLINWEVDGISFSGDFMDVPTLVAKMNVWDPDGNWEIDLAEKRIIGGAESCVYSNMDIIAMINNFPSVMGYNFETYAHGSSIDLEIGTHEVAVRNIVSGEQDTVQVVVTCHPEPATEDFSIFAGFADTFCLDLSELQSVPVMIANFCPEAGQSPVEFEFIPGTTCVAMQAISPGIQQGCIVVCDGQNFCDTTYLNVEVALVEPPSVFEFHSTIPLGGEVHVLCPDTDELQGTVDTIYNLCPNDDEEYVNFQLNDETFCVKYRGVSCGPDTACVVICDDLDVCDTTYLYITVQDDRCNPPTEYVYDTVFVNQSETHCLNLTDLAGAVQGMKNVCPDASGDNVIFDMDDVNFCVSYTGLEVGTDTACMVLTDEFNISDTTCVIVTTRTVLPDFIQDSIVIGSAETYCIDTSELPGTVESIENICPDASGNFVDFTINDLTLCVEAQSLALGTENACIVICDENDICDTTYIYITVVEDKSIEPETPLIAVNDTAYIPLNTSEVFNVLSNDTIPGTPVDLTVVSGPQNGLVMVNTDFTIRYAPNKDFCGRDTFDYRICNRTVCDTATVVIYIDCDPIEPGELIIYDGISPNGDGTNDTFVIKGLEAFPDNVVRIFNRWGNQLYQKDGYDNSWGGSWEGKDLPDGTYFYLLDLDEETQLSGFIQLNR